MAEVVCAENGISDGTNTCNISPVSGLIPLADSDIVSDGQILSHLASNTSKNGKLSDKEYPNGISPLYELANCDNILDNCSNTVTGNAGDSASNIVPSTIFENAVKVVKNLFSPAKGHGIFSRGTSPAFVNENGMKKEGDEENRILHKSLLFTLDEVSAKEEKGRVSPLTNLENDVNPIEEDMSNLSLKNSSSSISIHDNTNDSYTTTISRMDESFQSTITHFDENMVNELKKVNEPVTAVENCSDGSLNETLRTNENSLDNTLKKNLSICSTVNGDLNGTFDVPTSKVEDGTTKELNMEREKDITPTQKLDQVLPVSESPENYEEVHSLASVSEENFLSFQEEGMLKIGTFSSTPSKRNSSKENLLEMTVSKSLSEQDQKGCHVNGEHVDSVNSSAAQDMDNVSVSQRSGVNHSPENEFSFLPIRNENELPEKCSTPNPIDMEKNVSSSTIILTKDERETLDCCRENEAVSIPFDHIQKMDETVILDETNIKKSAAEGSQGQVPSSNILGRNILSPVVGKGMNTNGIERNDDFDAEPKVDPKVTNSPRSESNSCEDISHPCLKSEIPDVDLKTSNLTSNLQTGQLKPEECSSGIPLASQKSYTVLHNLNPDLNRPVVLDCMRDVEAEKLNDIILGNCAFSDLGIFNNCLEDLISYGSKSTPQMSESNCSTIPNSSKSDAIGSSNVTFESRIPLKENVDLKTAEISGQINDIPIHAKQEFDIDEVFPMLEKQMIDSCESTVNNERFLDSTEDPTAVNIQPPNDADILTTEPEVHKNNSVVALYQGPILTGGNFSEVGITEVKEQNTDFANSFPVLALDDGIQSASHTENNTSKLHFCGDGGVTSTENIEPVSKDENDFFEKDPVGINSSETKSEMSDFQNQIEKVTSDLERLKMNDSLKKDSAANCCQKNNILSRFSDSIVSSEQKISCENSKDSLKGPVSGSDTELTQFIQEQFTAFDIEKICSIVDDIPELNLSKNIVLASRQFDKSFHEKTIIESDSSKENNFAISDDKSLSSALDFLDSIKGKPSGRDFSRESLYIKFDPLVQSKHSTELMDISEGDKENLIISPAPKSTATTEPLIPITPLKQTINVSSPLSPLTPVTQKNEPKLSNEKMNKIRELQAEIARSRELFLQKEEINKEKMNNYEREIAKLTGRACVLEAKLKEKEETEQALVKKLNVHNDSVNRLKNIVEEYLVYMGKLADQIEMERMESHKQIEVLTEERDYYMNHLHKTEQAFSDVHSKYEKCKKAVKMYKKNEETYKTSVDEFKERIEQYRVKVRDIQENAEKEMNRLQEQMSDMKRNHAQEISRFKAQLRKTELKVQTIQEALDQKVKENQELARICDELIDGKKRNC